MNHYIYDIETFPNVFLFGVHCFENFDRYIFEISEYCDDREQLTAFLNALRAHCMVGFNNLAFDYPVIHDFIRNPEITVKGLYDKAMSIINTPWNDRFNNVVYKKDRFIEQLDLYKIHHFDNVTRATSLKVLEFNMQMPNIRELPFNVGIHLNHQQTRVLRDYLHNDLDATLRFYVETLPMIKFRREISAKYDRDFMNHNDTKIGKDYFIMRLEQAGVQLYEYGDTGRTPRQTKRQYIRLSDAIIPDIPFTNPEFIRVRDWLLKQVVTETKGVFKDLTATVNNFTFVLGLGGIHGSIESRVMESDDEMVIVDLDVTSYYPRLATLMKFYPAHLGSVFCEIYEDVFQQRKQYKKGTAENAMLKLALNGVYGDTNSKFSVFYDPLTTMRVTLNGQLLLCLLSENMMQMSGLQMIQVNTDGITVYLPRSQMNRLYAVKSWWEELTGLQLEEAIYKRMFIRDVNNYLAEYENGEVKRKGAYEYKLDWNQNFSALVVPKVAEKVLLHDVNIRDAVENHPDFMDFMLRAKVTKGTRLIIEKEGEDVVIQNPTRYYISKEGHPLYKIMPPLAKKPNEWRRQAINSGWTVNLYNDVRTDYKTAIDYDYYIKEVEKLVMRLQ